ncbi:MAG: 30S ribosomal protein S20 [Rhodospirillaceae bacterium]|nr:30S ribosomal protein S20 [Rhodospirillaceae bacterium]
MAHSLQAKKRIRQTARRTDVNRGRRGVIRTQLRNVEEAIVSGDQEAAMKAFREMQPTLMSGVNKGLMEKNTVSRKLSRLSKRIKGMAA